MKRKNGKIAITIAAIMIMCTAMITGCGKKAGGEEICVISREDGSGTRDAFTELLGIMENDIDNDIAINDIANAIFDTVNNTTVCITIYSLKAYSYP